MTANAESVSAATFFFVNFLYDCQSAWKRSKNSRIQLPKVPIVFDFYDLLFPYTQFGFIEQEWVLSTLHTKFVSGRSIVQIIFLSFFMLSAIKKKRNYYSKILKYFSGDFVAPKSLTGMSHSTMHFSWWYWTSNNDYHNKKPFTLSPMKLFAISIVRWL